MRQRDHGIKHVPDNKSQNKTFRDATRGLNKSLKERVRREVEHSKRQYEDLNYDEIKAIADDVKRQNDEKI
jgi:hypothetical protein